MYCYVGCWRAALVAETRRASAEGARRTPQKIVTFSEHGGISDLRAHLAWVYNDYVMHRLNYPSASRSEEGASRMVEMSVESVRINLATNQRVVILKDTQSERYLFIWIANPEAYSIAMELQGTTSPRPLTHDLLKSVILELGGKLTNVIINDLVDDIFYARLVFDVEGRHAEVDSRPSDAIALAVRLKAPILVAESVLEQAGVTLDSSDERDEPAGTTRREKLSGPDNLDVYRDFINSLDALDEFGKQQD